MPSYMLRVRPMLGISIEPIPLPVSAGATGSVATGGSVVVVVVVVGSRIVGGTILGIVIRGRGFFGCVLVVRTVVVGAARRWMVASVAGSVRRGADVAMASVASTFSDVAED